MSDYIDPIAAMHQQRRMAEAEATPPSGANRQEYLENARYPLSFVWAFAVGVFVAMLGRYCQFHMLGMPAQGSDPDLQLIMDNVFAGLVAMVIQLASSFATREHMIAKMGGVWLVILTFHNLPHIAPGAMTMVFSRPYVQEVVSQTKGNSILFRGMEFHFGEPLRGRR